MNIEIISQDNFSKAQATIKKISEFDQEFFPFPWSLESWEKTLREKPFVIVVACEKEIILGFCFYLISELEQLAHLVKIVVHPESRKTGLAQEIHNAILKTKYKSLINTLYLEVSTINDAATKFYKKLGYNILVTKKNFYSNGEDAYAMQKSLI